MTGSGLAVVDNIKLGYAIELTPGTTPNVAFQSLRPKSQSLTSSLKFVESNEFRFDRQVSDQVLSDSSPSGQIGGELSFGAWDDFMLGAVAQANWTGIFSANNVGITSSSAISVPSGGLSVAANHIIRLSGFSTASNNNTFVVSSSTATNITVAGTPLTIEAAGAAKSGFVCGFTSSAGDIAATATGLASTSLNFTTLGLSIGAWIKIGGAATTNQFATQANNAIVRIAAISANNLSLDNLPAGWAVDAGTGRSIQVQVSSFVRNGTAPQSYTIERWHTDISPNQYFVFKGCYVDKASFTLAPGQILETSFDFKGLSANEGASSASAGNYIAAPANPILNAVGNIARVQEGGSSIGFLKKLTFNVSNTTREQKAVGTLGNVGIGQGRYSVEVQFEAYFTSGSLYQKFLNATQTSLAFAVRDGLGNAYVLTAPAVKLTAATINAGGIGQDVMLQATAKGLIDPLIGCMFQIDRIAA